MFEKGSFFRDKLKQALGEGIFNVDGHKWRVQRKTASTLFTTNNFRDLLMPVFRKNLSYIDTIIAEHIERGKTVNVLAVLGKYALDSFSEVSCGKPPIENKEFREGSSFEKSFERAQAIIEQRFRIPVWKLYEYVTGVAKQIKQSVAILDGFVYNIIDEREHEVKSGARSGKRDLLDEFMNVTKAGDEKLSKKELRDIMLSLLVAGRDTTSHALTWLLFYLIKGDRGPLIMEKIIEEFDYHCPGGEVTYDIAKDKLYIFQAVFYETLRLFPPVPKNLKCCTRDTVLPNGKILIKKGEAVSISPFASARLAVNWGPKATKFMPERWLHNIEDIANADPAELQYLGDCPRLLSLKDPRFIAFNSGPRRCIGSEFALIEAIMVGIHLIKKYEFKLSKADLAYNFTPDDLYLLRNSRSEVLYLSSLTMPKKGGLLLDMKIRAEKGATPGQADRVAVSG